nr:hypothetical protein [Myxococcota bacterium]
SQTCVVGSGTGPVTNANITAVTITCTTNQYTIGGTVSGLAGSGLVLRNNGGNALAISGNGSFTFTTAIASGATFAVTVQSQPTTPTQTCAVTGGTGTVGGANVTSVVVNCSTSTFTVGGTISGLAGTVVLQNNGGDSRSLSTNGSFAFSTPLASGSAYAVTVQTQPGSPSQTCTVASGTGTVTTSDITSVSVTCTTNTFTVGGTLSGLASGATVVLRNNNANDLTLTTNGSFTFAVAIASGQPYAVTVFANPTSPAQFCTVASGSGTVGAANVTNVVVTCGFENGTVRDVFGAVSGILIVPCGDGSNSNCTQAVAESSCTALGRKLVSHASDGTAGVLSLGATNSCSGSISYFTADASLAGQCLIGISNASWSASCCGLGWWHGHIVTIPAAGAQFGTVDPFASGYNSSLNNVGGRVWGCNTVSEPPPTHTGCTTYNVACR